MRRAREAIVIVGLLVLAVGCGRGPNGTTDGAAAGDRAGAPVILVSIDTLRSDRLPAYGYDRVATPALDALRRDAVLFRHAYSHVPLTLPAHASVLTGLLPSEHGVRDNLGYRLALAPEDPYLPRLLGAAGYATGAAVSAFVLRPETGLGAHFDRYDADIERIEARGQASLGEVQRPGGDTGAAALEWIRSVADRPFFLFFHIYEPHSPYSPPSPFAERYADPYDGEIAAADQIVGELFAGLRGLGLYDRALIVLFSDHGEGLGDHGEREHGLLLYREALQVPLMVKLPDGRHGGRVAEAPAQLIDIAPTVLEVLGRPVPERLQGRSLLGLLDADGASRPIYAETFYPRLHMGWSELTSLIADGYQLIDGPDPELYNLAADPRQTTNVLSGERRVYRSLADRLAGFESELAAPSAVDEETAQRLAALGYLATSAPATEGPRPDPKSKIHLLNDLAGALELIAEERFQEAIPALEQLLAENPSMQDAWQALALAHHRTRRWEQAAEAYRKVIDLVGPQPNTLLSLAGLYLDTGSLSAAAEHAEMALEGNPRLANQRLAEIALAGEDVAAAERYARAAVAARGGTVMPLILLTKILGHQGKLTEARATLDQVEAALAERTIADPLPNASFIRGDLMAREGQVGAALEAFRAELEAFPENLDAHARLAFLLAVDGQPDAATAALRTMVEQIASPAAYAAAIKTLRALGDRRQASTLLAFARRQFPSSEQLRALG